MSLITFIIIATTIIIVTILVVCNKSSSFIAIISLVVFVLCSSPESSHSGHVEVSSSELEVRLVETICDRFWENRPKRGI